MRMRFGRNAYGYYHRRSQGEQRGHGSPKFLENIVILCFERRFFKHNRAIRLKSNILAPQKFLGWLHHWVLPAFVTKKLPERLGLHHYAVNTHPDEFVPELPLK